MFSHFRVKQKSPSRIAIVDDDPLLCEFWQATLGKRYGKRVRIETYGDPRLAIAGLGPGVSLVLLDWHMPHLDGKTFLAEAEKKGLGRERFIIFSGSPIDNLHETFSAGECLAVIEKGAADQEEVLIKILDELIGQQKILP